MATLEKYEKTPYEALGVSPNASKDEIRSAYRRLARRHHPDSDLTTSRSPARFKEISDAYEVLSDDDQRARLDAILQAGNRPERNLEGQLRDALAGPDNSLRSFLLNVRVALDRDVRRGVENAAANLRKGLLGLKDNRRNRTDDD